MEGFDWTLEQARRMLEGPGFAPLRMTLWQPIRSLEENGQSAPGFLDSFNILFNNALQMLGLAKSLDGAPLVQGVNTFKGSPLLLLSRVIDGNLQELAGGPLFLLLASYYETYGPVYKLAFGPKSFMVVSDPVMARHILKENPSNYDKGILAEILEPVMGKGLIPADPETWKVRRKAIVPGFHKAWLNAMMALFVDCNKRLVSKLDHVAESHETINMETEFCSVSLDIIGRAVFNYDFGSVDSESPVVKAVYRALQEAEHRSTSFIPYWNLPFANLYMKNLQDLYLHGYTISIIIILADAEIAADRAEKRFSRGETNRSYTRKWVLNVHKQIKNVIGKYVIIPKNIVNDIYVYDNNDNLDLILFRNSNGNYKCNNQISVAKWFSNIYKTLCKTGKTGKTVKRLYK